jgi:hypothetical protein
MMANADDSQAWLDGAFFGRQFVRFAISTQDAPAALIVKHLAVMKALRSGYSSAEWKEWPGREFLFHTGALQYALSVAWDMHHGPLRKAGFSDLASAKEMCARIWVLWFTPDQPMRALEHDELERLKQPDFVRAFVDGAARAI